MTELETDFRDKYVPTFFTSEQVDKYFSFVEDSYKCYFNYDYPSLDNCIKLAILSLCAHLLYLLTSNEVSNGGNGTVVLPTPRYGVVSKSVGEISISFGSSSQGKTDFEDYFKSSLHGQQFLIFIKSLDVGACFV